MPSDVGKNCKTSFIMSMLKERNFRSLTKVRKQNSELKKP